MRNDYENCWFYKLCKKECATDVGMIFVGAALLMLMVFLFKWVISTYQIIGIIVGGGLVVKGFTSFFTKLPRVKAFLLAMPPQWYISLGNIAPQCMFGTFYPTEYYLCIPSEYIMIRYCDIMHITVQNNMTKEGSQTGITLKLQLAVEPREIDISVSKWQDFQIAGDVLISMINEKKNAMLAAANSTVQ